MWRGEILSKKESENLKYEKDFGTHYEAGRYQEALECCNYLIQNSDIDNEKKSMRFWKVFCLRGLNRFEEAWETAQTADITQVFKHYLVDIALKISKYQEALDILEQIIDKSNGRISYFYYYAHAYLGLGDRKAALDELERFPFYPFQFDALAHLLHTCRDPHLKEKFTLDDLKHYFEKVIRYELINFYTKHTDYSQFNILYQYQRFSLEALSNIQNQVLYLGDFNNFNDPADPPLKLDRERFSPILDAARGVRIASLTTKNDNILMWSHYADRHRGICIEYDLEGCLRTGSLSIHKVSYRKEIKIQENLLRPSEDVERKTLTAADMELLGIFTIKNEDWQYENEYRIIGYFNGDSCSYTIPVKIKAIYLGKDISLLHQQMIEKTVEGSGIQLFKIKPNTSNLYLLDKEPIERSMNH